jgi:hypothetical protein
LSEENKFIKQMQNQNQNKILIYKSNFSLKCEDQQQNPTQKSTTIFYTEQRPG